MTSNLNFGISTASFFGVMNNEDCFEAFRHNNVQVAEIFLSTFSEYQPQFAELLKSRIDGIMVHSVHSKGMQYEAELFSSHARVKADAVEMLRLVCSAAKELGAKFVTFHGPLKLKRHSYTHDYKKLSQVVNEICTILSEYNLNLSYENIHYGYFDTPEYFEKLASLCPNLYATIDVKQAVQAGRDPIDFLKACGQRVSTVHLCDVGLDNKPCMPFEGTVQFDRIFNYLVQYDIKATLMLELYSDLYTQGLQDLFDCYDILSAKLANSKGNILEFKLQ